MQEHSITVSSKTYVLEEPFFVLATQNPIEQEGTYPLPEAQLDRFMFSLLLDYPAMHEEIRVLEVTTTGDIADIQPVVTGEEIVQFHRVLRRIPVPKAALEYAVRLFQAISKASCLTCNEDGDEPPITMKSNNPGPLSFEIRSNYQLGLFQKPVGADYRNFPVRLSIPVPRATHRPDQPMEIRDEREEVIASMIRSFVFWDDGSVRVWEIWFHANLKLGETRRFYFHPADETAKTVTLKGLFLQEPSSFSFMATLGDGSRIEGKSEFTPVIRGSSFFMVEQEAPVILKPAGLPFPRPKTSLAAFRPFPDAVHSAGRSGRCSRHRHPAVGRRSFALSVLRTARRLCGQPLAGGECNGGSLGQRSVVMEPSTAGAGRCAAGQRRVGGAA